MNGILIALALASIGQPAAETKAAKYPKQELLAEVEDVSTGKSGVSLLLLDSRPRKEYVAGHIPGAIWVNHSDWAKSFADGKDNQGWSERIGALGINLESTVVVYDDAQSKEAARIWWILRYWGVNRARLLNGGWPAWKKTGSHLADMETRPVATNPRLTPNPGRLATKDQIMNSRNPSTAQIIDTRSAAEHCGDLKMAIRNGSIPGAIHLEWSEVIRKDDGRFKTADELTKLFSASKIDLNNPQITHCQSGGRAAVMAFAMELMGGKQVQNYYKSWAEWGNAEDTAIEIPKK